MKEFLFIYRTDPAMIPQGSPEEMQAMTKRWMDWIGGIAGQNKLSAPGNRLEGAGKVLKPKNVITDGPYTELKEIVSGYSIVKAATLEEACDMAKGCPGLSVGGSVEVRPVNPM